MKTIIRINNEWTAKECDETKRENCVNCLAYNQCQFKPFNPVAYGIYAIGIIVIILFVIWGLA
jgi:hypothetical protein